MSSDTEGGGMADEALQIQVSAKILQHAIDRWLAQISMAPIPGGAITAEVRSYAERMGWQLPELHSLQGHDIDDREHLLWLLSQAEKENQPWLAQAMHRAVGLLSCEVSFCDAVERAARRQMYNLAYGLTHEINNPLGNMVARAQRLLLDTTDAGSRKSLSTIMDQGMRAHEMLAEVMRAVQPAPLALSTTDVSALVHQVWESLKDRARESGIEWRWTPNPRGVFAAAHAPSLLDALRMLGLNALEICGANDSIDWSCELISHAAHAKSGHSKSGHSPSVRIRVQDTGPGLSVAAQRSAWDLYFSGREHGRGLGISLAVVKRIVEQHHGTIALRSEAGAGCCVEMELPGVATPEGKRPKITW